MPPALAALVMRCLEKDPATRPQSARRAARARSRPLAHAVGARRDARRVAPRSPRRASPSRRGVAGAGARRARRRSRGVVASGAPAGRAPSSPCSPCCRSRTSGRPATRTSPTGSPTRCAAASPAISGLRVIGGASARQYKGTTKSPREIARELGATHLLTGTVRWERAPGGGGRVRVQPASWCAPPTRRRVWAEPVEGRSTDVFRVQASVAERVAACARRRAARRASGAPWPQPRRRSRRVRRLPARRSPHAAQSVALGQRRRAAIAELERAVALDPSFAAAHARLAQAYGGIYLDGTTRTVLPRHGRARSAPGRWTRPWSIRASRARRTLTGRRRAGRGRARCCVRVAEAARKRGGTLSSPSRRSSSAGRTAARGRAERHAARPTFARRSGDSRPSPEHRYAEAIGAREQEIALTPEERHRVHRRRRGRTWLWRADTAAARKTLERGGPEMREQWLHPCAKLRVRAALWQAVLPAPTLRVRDTLTLEGYPRATNGGSAPERSTSLHEAAALRASGRTAERARLRRVAGRAGSRRRFAGARVTLYPDTSAGSSPKRTRSWGAPLTRRERPTGRWRAEPRPTDVPARS